MKKITKIFSACIISTMLLSSMAGCNKTSDTSKPQEAMGNETKKTPTKISFWQFWNIDDSDSSIKPAIDKFNKQNPDIIVDPTQLGWGDGFARIQTAIGAGTAPDVLELGSTWVGAFLDLGALSDLTPYIGDFKKDLINWELGEKDGKSYVVPWAVGARALAMNHDLLKKAGLDPAKPPKNWNELYDYAKTIKEKTGENGFCINVSDPTGGYQLFNNFLFSAGGNMIINVQEKSGDKTVEKQRSGVMSPESKKAMDFLVKMKPYSLIDTLDNAKLQFANGKLGMFIVESSLYADLLLQGKAPKEWSSVAIPASPDTGKSKCFLGAEVLTIPVQSKNKEAAVKFLRYASSAPVASEVCKFAQYSILPSTSNLAEDPAFKNPGNESIRNVIPFIQLMKDGKAMPPPLHKDIENIGMRMSVMMDEIFSDNMNPEKAMKECETEINKLYLK